MTEVERKLNMLNAAMQYKFENNRNVFNFKVF
jgi:hypothetical protein